MLLQRIKPTRSTEAGIFIETQAGGNVKVSPELRSTLGIEAGHKLDVAAAGEDLFLLVEKNTEATAGYKYVSTGHFNSKTVINTLGGEKNRYSVDIEAGFEPEGEEGVMAYPLSLDVEKSEELKAKAEASEEVEEER